MMQYFSLLWTRGSVSAERRRRRGGGEGKRNTYQLGLASILELSYLKCGRVVFGEIGITQSHRRLIVGKNRGTERGATYCVNRAFFYRGAPSVLQDSLRGEEISMLFASSGNLKIS